MRPFSVKTMLVAAALTLSICSAAEAGDLGERTTLHRPQHHTNRNDGVFQSGRIATDNGQWRNGNHRAVLSERSLDRRWASHGRSRFQERQFDARDHDRQFRYDRHVYRNDRTYDDRFFLPPENDYYGGGLSAWYDPGNGLYLHRYRTNDRFYDRDEAYDAPRSKPKIIHVRPGRAQQACSWESGVCVIRR